MDDLLELIKDLNIKIGIMLANKGTDEESFLRMYAKSKSVQIAFAMGSRSMATTMAKHLIGLMGEEE